MEYYHSHKEQTRIARRKYQSHKERTDIKFKLKRRLRNRLYYALQKRSWKKDTKFAKYIGCDLDFLREYLQDQFLMGMTWENYGDWEIDHKIPLDSANTEDELYSLCHYSNLQPLWKAENRKKSNKVA